MKSHNSTWDDEEGSSRKVSGIWAQAQKMWRREPYTVLEGENSRQEEQDLWRT